MSINQIIQQQSQRILHNADVVPPFAAVRSQLQLRPELNLDSVE